MFIAFSAGLAIETGVGEPFDTYTIAELDWGVLGVRANGDNDADTLRIEFNYYYHTMSSDCNAHFVTTDEGGLSGYRPVVLRSVKIGVADTGALHLEENLTGSELLGLRDGPVVDDLEGGAGVADHSGLHGFGDNVVAVRHVCVVEGDACERKVIGRREQRYLCSLRLASQRGPSEVSYGTRIAL